MKGLLVKDFRLLLQRKKLMVLYLFVAVMISFTTDTAFLVPYMAMLGVLLGTSTISYDELDNGYSFLMTLPVNGKIYAREKHLFTYLCLLVFWSVAMVFAVISGIIMQTPASILADSLVSSLFTLPLFTCLVSILLPVELKFGAEKSRIVMMAVFGIVLVISILGGSIMRALNINTAMVAAALNSVPVFLFAGVIILITLAVVATTISCSAGIMTRKEY